MLELLKKLFSFRNGEQTVIVVNDDGTKPSTSYRLHPVRLWLAAAGFLLGVIILIVALLWITPAGNLIYNKQEMRSSVIAIQQQVAGLQDTIEARNMQLNQIKSIIVSGPDSAPGSEFAGPSAVVHSKLSPGNTSSFPDQNAPPIHLAADEVLINNLFEQLPRFPVQSPIEGSPTRGFTTANGHFGLDIAAPAGRAFKAIAPGVVINEEWTFNYGYVIMVQHADGIITIYKHAETVDKSLGETVRQGDIIGTIGNVGILSSGPHLHIEIWQHGIPQNPHNYLIN